MKKERKDIKDMNSIESLAFMELLKEADTKVIIAMDENNEPNCYIVQGNKAKIMSMICALLRKFYEDKENCILIDDYTPNLTSWIKAGGKGIKKAKRLKDTRVIAQILSLNELIKEEC